MQVGPEFSKTFNRYPSNTAAGKRVSTWFWTGAGIIFFLLEAFIWIKWFSGPNFATTPPVGPDSISGFQRNLFTLLQFVLPIVMVVCAWYWILLPWKREGRLTTDGMLAISIWAIVIFDPTYSYASTAVFYNSNLINFGAWTLGSMPGWMSPLGNRLPEPILITIPSYLISIFGQILVLCWVLRKYHTARPTAGFFKLLAIIVFTLTLSDCLIEIVFIRTGIYSYPAAIHALTLWPGEWYQFPLTEGVLFGGLATGACAALRYFRNDKGETFVEQGINELKYNNRAKQWIRFFSIFGFVHSAFLLIYMIPSAWVALHTDAFPENTPSYLENNMCVYGVEGNECPGPGVMIPRVY